MIKETNAEYGNMYLQDYNLGEPVPKEAFYFKDENWIAVDNRKEFNVMEFKFKETCLLYFKAKKELEEIMEEINSL